MQKQQISVSKQPKLFHSGAACAGEAAKCLLKKKSQMALKKILLQYIFDVEMV